jgi:hypothetical protein
MGASAATFDMMAIVLLACNDRNNVGTGFKRSQNMLGLQPSRTGNNGFLHAAG